ncbi:MAG: hypothetical protein AB8G11_21320 [Saprospiraceae bacterium]
MKGINYLTDENNHKIAVQIDLNLYGDLWEDFYDRILVEQRKNEASTPFKHFIKKLN